MYRHISIIYFHRSISILFGYKIRKMVDIFLSDRCCLCRFCFLFSSRLHGSSLQTQSEVGARNSLAVRALYIPRLISSCSQHQRERNDATDCHLCVKVCVRGFHLYVKVCETGWRSYQQMDVPDHFKILSPCRYFLLLTGLHRT